MQSLYMGMGLGRALAGEPGGAEGSAKARTKRTGVSEGPTAADRPSPVPAHRDVKRTPSPKAHKQKKGAQKPQPPNNLNSASVNPANRRASTLNGPRGKGALYSRANSK